MRARIFQQAKSSMQSGMAGVNAWILEWEPSDRRTPDPLMGWWGSRDTQSQVGLRFDTKEEAIAFAERSGLPYDLELPRGRAEHKPKVYADNFKYGRVENWTH